MSIRRSITMRSLLLCSLQLSCLGLAAAAVAGCGDSEVASASMEAVSSDPTACQEQHPDAVVAFVVGPDGAVRAGATGADGKPAKIEGGTLGFRKDGAAPVEAKLAPEGDGTVATAKGPPMDADVTAMDYAVQVEHAGERLAFRGDVLRDEDAAEIHRLAVGVAHLDEEPEAIARARIEREVELRLEDLDEPEEHVG